MAQFTANPHRFDPYQNFKFRVKWDGEYVAGLSKCSALKRTTEVTSHREGGDPSSSRKQPGRTEYEAIAGAGSEVSLKDFRKDILIDIFNEAGQKVLSYKVYRCWVSEYTAFPDLDANANAVAIQSIKLENEGWERDTDVTESTEPTLP
ncbi:MAG: phage tail protein [Planctomycetota bacterium]|jgi:hypothetical protein